VSEEATSDSEDAYDIIVTNSLDEFFFRRLYVFLGQEDVVDAMLGSVCNDSAISDFIPFVNTTGVFEDSVGATGISDFIEVIFWDSAREEDVAKPDDINNVDDVDEADDGIVGGAGISAVGDAKSVKSSMKHFVSGIDEGDVGIGILKSDNIVAASGADIDEWEETGIKSRTAPDGWVDDIVACDILVTSGTDIDSLVDDDVTSDTAVGHSHWVDANDCNNAVTSGDVTSGTALHDWLVDVTDCDEVSVAVERAFDEL
jgi:hypothetical protein